MHAGTRRSCSRLATRASPLTSPTTGLPVSVRVRVRVRGGGGALMAALRACCGGIARIRTCTHTHQALDAPAMQTWHLGKQAIVACPTPVAHPNGTLGMRPGWSEVPRNAARLCAVTACCVLCVVCRGSADRADGVASRQGSTLGLRGRSVCMHVSVCMHAWRRGRARL